MRVAVLSAWTQAAIRGPRWAGACSVHTPAAAAAAATRRRPAAAAAAYSSSSGPASSGGRTALVQGSSRGIGLEFATQLLERPGTAHVIATCRNPAASPGLQELQQRHGGRLTVLPMDTSDEGSLAAAAAAVAAAHTHLDLLINASGILHDAGTGLAPETALSRVTMDSLLQNFSVNAAGHILTLKHFAPLLAAAAQHNGATQERPAVAASLTARVGSIGDNRLGGWFSYRAAKAAANQLNKCAALEFQRRKQAVAAIVLHPGTVDTGLSKPFQRNVPAEKLFTKERAVRQLLAIIDRATMAESGRFFDWKGDEVEW